MDLLRRWVCHDRQPALRNGHIVHANVLAIVWLAFWPSAASVWTTVAAFTISMALCIAEQVAIKKVILRTPGSTFLVRGFVASSCVMVLAGVLVITLINTAFGSLRMAGSRMTPTLEKGERLIYHKHIDWPSVQPGAVVVYKNADDSAWGQPGQIIISRILAGPGDDISIQNGNYVVNGTAGPPVAGTGNLDVALDIPPSPESLTVPEGCYFVVQDSPAAGFDRRVLSWARTENIMGLRLWYFSRRGIGKPVE